MPKEELNANSNNISRLDLKEAKSKIEFELCRQIPYPNTYQPIK